MSGGANVPGWITSVGNDRGQAVLGRGLGAHHLLLSSDVSRMAAPGHSATPVFQGAQPLDCAAACISLEVVSRTREIVGQKSAAPWRIAAYQGAALPDSDGLRSHLLCGLGMLLLACARREATHDLDSRERYLFSRIHLYERRCLRLIVLLTSSSIPAHAPNSKRLTSRPDHNTRGGHERSALDRAARTVLLYVGGEIVTYYIRPRDVTANVSAPICLVHDMSGTSAYERT
jgi:hypothetical protein